MPDTSLQPQPDSHQARIRLVTATALFDGHDASINLIRRLLLERGAEVIHLGHNRTAEELARCAVQEGAQGIAVSSYQGGHLEFFSYLCNLLAESSTRKIHVFAGGGSTILPAEVEELLRLGVSRVFTSEEGKRLGLAGITDKLMAACGRGPGQRPECRELVSGADDDLISSWISVVESFDNVEVPAPIKTAKRETLVLGVTGPGGAGKSCLIDEIVARFLVLYPDKRVAILAVDPVRRKTGGALLGDRLRINSSISPKVFMRSFSTRCTNQTLSAKIPKVLDIFRVAGFDLAIVETAGTGQANTEIVDVADKAVYVMTPDFGSGAQLEKIGMLDFAAAVAVNKSDRMGAQEAVRLVKKHLKSTANSISPVFGTIASRPRDPGIDSLFQHLFGPAPSASPSGDSREMTPRQHPCDGNYLQKVVEQANQYEKHIQEQSSLARRVQSLTGLLEEAGLHQPAPENPLLLQIQSRREKAEGSLTNESKNLLAEWDRLRDQYARESFRYNVRGHTVVASNRTETISGLGIPRVNLPKYSDWGDRLTWLLKENVPGRFPFTAGVYPFRRTDEERTRMVVGEGTPERTNRRYHYILKGTKSVRLSTAFDPVTIYGEDPGNRPDVYGRIGTSGVSVASLDDMKKLYSGFDLCSPHTSVSLIINGPAPSVLAFFFNTAIDQQCELYIREQGLEKEVERVREAESKKGSLPRFRGASSEENKGLGLLLLGLTGDQVLPAETYDKIKRDTLRRLRGTLQADVLKEVQAQNICLFPLDFSLKMVGDIQEYFVRYQVRNFYSLSVSGYHMAEAGANPITQLAFSLANALTYVEYFLSKGMKIDDFAPNLSFFFSSGMDLEYSVLERVSRRVWAKAIRFCYGGHEQSQKLKCHVQTSGRSLQLSDLDFNDARTTLQALSAVYDNCNSLHTNAYDEPVTTPTEESVRRALAIQLIIEKEFGLAQIENPLQGSYAIETLTDLVEKSVYEEFIRISQRGGVLEAMQTNYQRDRIQEDSIKYERLKETGALPIVGTNVFERDQAEAWNGSGQLSRSTEKEKQQQVQAVEDFKRRNKERSDHLLNDLAQTISRGENVFDCMMEVSKFCSLGQITEAIYQMAGRYRRNL